jgi:hypothetical protein
LTLSRRIADVDSKLNGILELLSRNDLKSRPDDHSAGIDDDFDVDQYPATTSYMNGAFNSVVVEPHGSSLERDPCLRPLYNSHCGIESELASSQRLSDSEYFAGLGLTWADLQSSLAEYRLRQASFPFVVIPADFTISLMIEDRPCLLLAIVTTVKSDDLLQQQRFSKGFTEIIARKVVVEGERSIDLLQGLLIYLAWYHFFWIPRSQQLYGHLQIAVGMMVDLGLDQALSDALAERCDLRLRKASNVDTSHLPDLSHDIAAQRAAFGCFHLSSLVSAAVTKPNNIKLNDYLLKSARALEESAEADTDVLIYPLMRLDQIVEHARELYHEDKSGHGRTRLHTHAVHMLDRLEEWLTSLSPVVRGSRLLQHAYRGTKIRILEMGLVYRFGPGLFYSEQLKQKAPPGLHVAHPGLIQNLSFCTDAAKDYLDIFLDNLTPDQYHAQPLEEWLRLIFAPFVLYRLCVGVREVPDWTVETARSTVDLEYYLREIGNRLRASIDTSRNVAFDDAAEATLSFAGPPRHDMVGAYDLFSLLPLVFGNARDSFTAVKDGGVSPDKIRAHQHLGTIRQSKQGRQEGFVRCPATTNLPRPSTGTVLPAPSLRVQSTQQSLDRMITRDSIDGISSFMPVDNETGSTVVGNGDKSPPQETDTWSYLWTVHSPLSVS